MDTSESQTDIYKSFIKNTKDYILLNYDLLRLKLIEKLALIIALVLSLFIGILLIIIAIVYFSFAFVHWTAALFESLIPGSLIVGGLFILLFIIFFSLRKRLFVNPMIKLLSNIIFNEPQKPEENENK